MSNEEWAVRGNKGRRIRNEQEGGTLAEVSGGGIGEVMEGLLGERRDG